MPPKDKCLSFGIELEMVTVLLTEDDDANTGYLARRDLLPMVTEDLNSNGYPAQHNGFLYIPCSDFTKWGVHFDGSIQPSRSLAYSLVPELDREAKNRLVPVGMELASPIFTLQSEWESQIEGVVKQVTTGKFRSGVDVSCGLHVHVGLPSGAMLPLETIQKVTAIMVLAEDVLGQMHPDYRRGTHAYNKPLRRQSIWGNFVLRDDVVFSRIFEKKSLHGLVSIFTLENSCAQRTFKIVNDEEKRTLEFRQHEGTLDPEQITMWARFVVGLVEAASEIEVDALERLLVTPFRRTPLTLEELFNWIVPDPEVREYYLKPEERRKSQARI
jgi:hypothetical protein